MRLLHYVKAKHTFSFLLFLFFLIISEAQPAFQTIKGRILDSTSRIPIDSVQIVLVNDASLQAFSNVQGEFLLNNVPVGKQGIMFIHPMYEPLKLSGIVVSSDNEIMLEAEMISAVYSLESVTISGAKTNPISGISHHVLDMNKAKKLAGTLADPNRMLVNFPGVTNPDDSRNSLIVRGNSPVGVGWYIEGLPSLNPNHFATAGNSGGGINILNPYALKKIDFYTGSFPAKYGNALSAIVDVSLRPGNNQEWEHHFRTTLVDIEVGTEGPIDKKNKSSYLAIYRRFNVDLAQKMYRQLQGFVGNAPDAQDFTFKLHFPHKKGSTSFYGILGNQSFKIERIL